LHYIATHPQTATAIEFSRNGWESEEVATIYGSRKGWNSEPQTDYFAGIFFDSVQEAINYALRGNRCANA
jgi:hypothetical protein